MGKILVAVDGSVPANKAAAYAAELASRLGSSIKLVYVRVPVAYPDYTPLVPELASAARREGDTILEETARHIRQMNVEVQGNYVEAGSAAEAIADEAKAEDVEMVVVGTRGRGAVARVLIGSVADRLVHICPKPVLVYR
jgi:nucleotide-binding universal stress UspA family protein